MTQRRKRFVKITPEQRERLDGLGFAWEAPHHNCKEHEWDEKFSRLQEYQREQLDCRVPRGYKPDPELGEWVFHQRNVQNKGTMRHDRLTKLDSIGFAWSKPRKRKKPIDHFKRDEKWLESYNKLVDFSKEHGHCLVPKSYDKDKPFAHWVDNQRSLQAQKILRQDRKELLDKIGFVWNVGRKVGKTDAAAITSRTQPHWDAIFERLVEFKQMNGHPNVPQRFKIGDLALGDWVSRCRMLWKDGELDSQRAQRLREIGLEPAKDVNQSWNEKYEKLKAYQEKHGHCRIVVHGPKVQDRQLAIWVVTQRKCQKKDTLLPDRKAKLDEIGFVWQGSIDNDQRWNDMFARMKAYRKKNGHCRVLIGGPNIQDRQLSQWVQYQRSCHKKGTLRPDRKAKLDEIGFVWQVVIGFSNVNFDDSEESEEDSDEERVADVEHEGAEREASESMPILRRRPRVAHIPGTGAV
jgi:hypothetical protein